MVFDAEPIPNIEELFSKLSTARFLTKMDLCKGYCQIPIDEKFREITAFVTPHGPFQWKVMPFGIVSAPTVFSRLMRTLLKDIDHVINYIDDILIFTETWEEHMTVLRVMQRLREANLTAEPSKCFFGYQNLEFLGHIIGKGEVKPDDKKLSKILQVRKPQNKKQMRSFLGLIGYYREFIPNFSAVSAP